MLNESYLALKKLDPNLADAAVKEISSKPALSLTRPGDLKAGEDWQVFKKKTSPQSKRMQESARGDASDHPIFQC